MQNERMELRNKYQKLQISQAKHIGILFMAATAVFAMWAGMHAIEPTSFSQMANILTSKAGWLVAAFQAVTVKPLVADFFAARDALRQFFASVAKCR